MPIVPQNQIPVLTILYATNRLSASNTPLHAASADLNSRIGLIRSDITKLHLPDGAIVNAANKGLRGGGGVDGAIHRAAGPGLLRECRTLGGCNTGSAKITDAYALPCKKVIHAVGPVYGYDDDAPGLLKSCYETSLRLAVQNNLKSIAFSAISTGIYSFPSKEASSVAVKTVRDFLESPEGASLELVVFCNFELKDVNAYNEIIPRYFPPSPRAPKPKEPSNPSDDPKEAQDKPESLSGSAVVGSSGTTDEVNPTEDDDDAVLITKKEVEDAK